MLAQDPNVALSLAADLNLDDFHQAAVKDYQGAFVLMDLFRPGLAPACMDLVWNSSSVEELPDPEQAVRAMAWLAKPGGRVFVGVPYKYGPAGLLSRVLSQRARTWLGRMYTRPDLRRLMEAADLQVEAELTYLAGTFIGMLATKSI
ncbi:MAG: methyltransferase domain-containing protein [Anaerolineales bacterium]